MAKTFLNLSNNVKLPALGLGTWQATDPATAEPALNRALEIGYRHIDTAYVYGTERIIGKVLKEWFDSGKLKRDDVFITTKLPMQGIHPDRVDMFMKKSLERLQLDYVDLYLVHFTVGFKCDISTGKDTGEVEGRTDHVAVWKKMEEQVDAGLTKAIGLSNYNIEQIETVLKSARIKPVVLQIEVQVFLQQRALIDYCNKKGIAVVAYSPLGSPAYNNLTKLLGKPERKLPNIINNPVLKEIGKKYKKTPAQIALRFLIQCGVAPIPKTTTLKRLEENMNVFDFTIDDDDFKEICKLDKGEAGRLANFDIFDGVPEHPDYPFERI